MTAWHLASGERIRRTELHKQYGGSGQGGIAPSRTSPNVLLFTDPGVGHQHGYYDEWAEDGSFRYAGEGQTGDQRVTRGNRAIFEHVSEGRALRLFEGSSGVVKYVGEFTIDSGLAFSYVRRHATNGGQERSVIMFHLRRVLESVPPVLDDGLPGTGYRRVDEEADFAPPTPSEITDGDAYGRANRSHRVLQNRLADLVQDSGFRPLSATAAGPDYDIAWLGEGSTLIVVEIKSITDSNEIRQLRLGLGQVLDYRHTLERPDREVTPVLYVERRPVDIRWERLMAGVGVVLCWPGSEHRIGLQAEQAGPAG